jgi:hypothetical protein
MKENTSFGMPATPDEQIAALKAQLAEANAKLLAAGVDEVDANEGKGPMDSQGFPKKYVRLEIFAGRDAQDLSYVPLGINGYVVKVTRGKEVILPSVFVTECLAHAIEEIVTQSEGGLVTRPSLRFPYTVRGEATEQEYLDFSAKMREQGKAAVVRT